MAYLSVNVILSVVLIVALLSQFLNIYPLPNYIFAVLSCIGLIPVLISAVRSLKSRQLSIDLLASVALVFSLLAHEWQSAAFITLMLAFARMFDLWTDMKEKHIIEHLLKYRPVSVKVKRGDSIANLPIRQIHVGDEVVIESGERIPIDGSVISGQASINEATLTGESELVMKHKGSQVYSSTLNESGSLLVRAEKVGEDTTLAKIIALVEEASRKKSPTEKIATTFTQWYILVMLIGSVWLYIVTRDLKFILSLLLVVCADDIAVAVPLTFSVSIISAARRGILIKGSDVLENLPKLSFFITDKTGTLTRGKPVLRRLVTFLQLRQYDLLKLFACAAINSGHPVNQAIVSYAKDRHVRIAAPEEFHETPGEGIQVKKDNRKITSGKVDFLKRQGIRITPRQQHAIDAETENGYGVTALAVGNTLEGYVAVEDEIRPFAKSLVAATKRLGVTSWTMLTGDNEKVAARVSQEVGIDAYRYNVTPEQKLEYVERFKAEKKGKLAMIGDGVNDAAALALADVSFAMGTIGSDAAIEAADVALIHDNIEKILEAILISRKTMEIVRQNFIIWAVINSVGLILVFSGRLDPMGASAFNFVTDFFPILNALRMSTYTPHPSFLA